MLTAVGQVTVVSADGRWEMPERIWVSVEDGTIQPPGTSLTWKEVDDTCSAAELNVEWRETDCMQHREYSSTDPADPVKPLKPWQYKKVKVSEGEGVSRPLTTEHDDGCGGSAEVAKAAGAKSVTKQTRGLRAASSSSNSSSSCVDSAEGLSGAIVGGEPQVISSVCSTPTVDSLSLVLSMPSSSASWPTDYVTDTVMLDGSDAKTKGAGVKVWTRGGTRAVPVDGDYTSTGDKAPVVADGSPDDRHSADCESEPYIRRQRHK